jgi:hypothetical protein
VEVDVALAERAEKEDIKEDETKLKVFGSEVVVFVAVREVMRSDDEDEGGNNADVAVCGDE